MAVETALKEVTVWSGHRESASHDALEAGNPHRDLRDVTYVERTRPGLDLPPRKK